MKPIDDQYYPEDRVDQVIRGQNHIHGDDQSFKMKIEKSLWMNWKLLFMLLSLFGFS